MENLLQIVFILSIIKYSCKATFYKSYAGILLFAFFVGVFAYSIYPFVIQNNMDVFAQLFENTNSLGGLALLITLEAISGILVSISILPGIMNSKINRLVKLLKLTPGILIAGAVFYFELNVFYLFSGASFKTTALITAVGLFLLVLIIATGIRYFLSSESMRYEFKFLLNAILFVMAIILNAGIADYNQSSYSSDLAIPKLLVFFILVVVVGLMGFYIQKTVGNRTIKKIKKWI